MRATTFARDLVVLDHLEEIRLLKLEAFDYGVNHQTLSHTHCEPA
jgi:hypothetical protein